MTEAQVVAGFIAGFIRGAIDDLREAVDGFTIDSLVVDEDDFACTITFSSARTEGGTIIITPGEDRS